jgi:hypothetical protein
MYGFSFISTSHRLTVRRFVKSAAIYAAAACPKIHDTGDTIMKSMNTHCFSNPQSDAFIGVAVRSQNFLANFGHLIYLKRNGSIVMTEPNELPPDSYEDRIARGPTPIDLAAPHEFTVSFPESHFRFAVNEVEEEFDVGKTPKVFVPDW